MPFLKLLILFFLCIIKANSNAYDFQIIISNHLFQIIRVTNKI
jgi:hypothetical protein